MPLLLLASSAIQARPYSHPQRSPCKLYKNLEGAGGVRFTAGGVLADSRCTELSSASFQPAALLCTSNAICGARSANCYRADASCAKAAFPVATWASDPRATHRSSCPSQEAICNPESRLYSDSTIATQKVEACTPARGDRHVSQGRTQQGVPRVQAKLPQTVTSGAASAAGVAAFSWAPYGCFMSKSTRCTTTANTAVNRSQEKITKP